jgi:IS30 family transposase
MRIMPKQRRKRYNSKDSRGVLRGKRHISERPAEVELRQEPGHWEGDTVIGVDKRFSILTLVERRSGFAIIKKLKARTTIVVNAAAIQAISENRKMFKTITFDNGTEFHDYKQLEARFAIRCYFATPYHSWERGSNENLNGLIRQYVPKGACMKLLTQEQCNKIAADLNTRPRKRHGFKTPSEMYYAS